MTKEAETENSTVVRHAMFLLVPLLVKNADLPKIFRESQIDWILDLVLKNSTAAVRHEGAKGLIDLVHQMSAYASLLGAI